MIKHRFAAAASLSALAAALGPWTALSQEVTEAETAIIEDKEAVMGTVVVTATKRAAALQDIPVSVSAVAADALKDRGLSNIEDLSTLVPNLNWGEHAGTTMITIRGVGSTVDSGVTEPTVATYVDGVFLPRSTMATLRAVDIERIEVLRGPQGTLYGRNATGGAINFLSAAPSDSFEGEINLSIGDRSAFGASGYISGPLAKGVYGRLSGGIEEQEGYVDVLPGGQKLNETDAQYFRAALRLEPSDTISVDLSVRYDKNDAANAYQQLLTPTVLPTPEQTTAVNKIFADQPFGQQNETTIIAGTINWDISDEMSFKSLTSYVDHSSNVQFDADSTNLDGFNVVAFPRPSESYSQEFNLLGTFDRLSWLLGTYYFREEASNSLGLRLGSVFAPGFGVPMDTVLSQSVATKTEAYALFGELTYELTDRFSITGGLRFNDEKQDFLQNLVLDIPGLGQVPGGAAFAGGAITVSTSSDKVLPKVSVQYKLTESANVYAQWSRGFKSGGLNLEGGSGLSTGSDGLYRPESIDAYEVGFKSELFNPAFTANLAAFLYDYSDLQVTITLPPTTTFVQGADARIVGLEGEFTWQVADNFRLNSAFTLLDAKFDGFSSFDDANPAAGVQDLDGRRLPSAPKYTASLGAEYDIAISGPLLSRLTLRADAFHSGDVVLRYFGSPVETQDAYTLLNVSASLVSRDEKTVLRAFLNNVTDEEYLQNVTYIGAVGAFMGNYGAPSTWGVQLTRRF